LLVSLPLKAAYNLETLLLLLRLEEAQNKLEKIAAIQDFKSPSLSTFNNLLLALQAWIPRSSNFHHLHGNI